MAKFRGLDPRGEIPWSKIPRTAISWSEISLGKIPRGEIFWSEIPWSEISRGEIPWGEWTWCLTSTETVRLIRDGGPWGECCPPILCKRPTIITWRQGQVSELTVPIWTSPRPFLTDCGSGNEDTPGTVRPFTVISCMHTFSSVLSAQKITSLQAFTAFSVSVTHIHTLAISTPFWFKHVELWHFGEFNNHKGGRGEDGSMVRAPDSWLKGRRFEWSGGRSFLLQGRLSVLTLISVSVSPPCYRSST